MKGLTHGRSARRRSAALLGVGLLVVLAVPLAWASHQFTDVPNGHPFHADIAAIKDAGITAGKTCVPPGTPPTYCPTESITREAMAAFLHRGLGRVAAGAGGSTTLPSAGTLTLIASASITTGGVTGGLGFLRISGSGSVRADGVATCPCTALLVPALESEVGPATGPGSLVTRTGLDAWSSFAVEWVFVVQTATTYTVALRGQVDGGSEDMVALGNIVAEYVPFGGTGGNTLGPT